MTSILLQSCTFLAQWLAASALADIFFFDVVARIAIGIVVMHLLFHRMPGRFLSHSDLRTIQEPTILRLIFGTSNSASLMPHSGHA